MVVEVSMTIKAGMKVDNGILRFAASTVTKILDSGAVSANVVESNGKLTFSYTTSLSRTQAKVQAKTLKLGGTFEMELTGEADLLVGDKVDVMRYESIEGFFESVKLNIHKANSRGGIATRSDRATGITMACSQGVCSVIGIRQGEAPSTSDSVLFPVIGGLVFGLLVLILVAGLLVIRSRQKADRAKHTIDVSSDHELYEYVYESSEEGSTMLHT